MFSMAVLAAMVSMVIRMSISFWARAAFNEWILKDGASDGFTSHAMKQGGMGLIFTTLILTAPPMAAMFFQGAVVGFMACPEIGGSAAAGPQRQRQGAVPERTVDNPRSNTQDQVQQTDRTVGTGLPS